MTRLIALILLATPPDNAGYEAAVGSTLVIQTLTADREEGIGQGVLLGDGKILTAAHVVRETAHVWARAPLRDAAGRVVNTPESYRKDIGVIPLVVKAIDGKRDLALLTLKNDQNPGKPVAIASKSPNPGDPVFFIGGNERVYFRFCSGSVRAVYPSKAEFPGQHVDARLVDHSASLDPGDSGGGLFNAKGELVGINSFIETDRNQVHRAVAPEEIAVFLEEHNPPKEQKKGAAK